MDVIDHILTEYVLFVPACRGELVEAVALWCDDRVLGEKRYGHISYWNTIHITDMSVLFRNKQTFNEFLCWNTINVTDMSSMFSDCYSFNQFVAFNTKNVTNMSWMFYHCSSFNQLVSLDTRNVTLMTSMFEGCQSFNHSQKMLFECLECFLVVLNLISLIHLILEM